MPKLLLIELNEFNPDLILDVSRKLGLKNLPKLLALPHCATTTQDEIEHQGLDPWVQWANVHSGLPSHQHGVRRLGDTARQTAPQIWNRVAAMGYSWAAWGVMNAPRGDMQGCKLYVPDPWSYDERATPPQLETLLALPRHMATHYLDPGASKLLLSTLRSASYFLPPSQWPIAARFAAKLLSGIAACGANVHTFAGLLDYLGALVFLREKMRSKPDLSVIFLNLVAHSQHHFWTAGRDYDQRLLYAIRVADAIVALLLESLDPDEAVICMNSMRQENVAGRGFFVYRQIDPDRTINRLGVAGGTVQQCMTNESHILFDTVQEADAAEQQLRSLTLGDGSPLLFLERDHPTKVFAQICIDNPVPPDARIVGTGIDVAFYDLFALVCERTGAHTQTGDLYYKSIDIGPGPLFNHQIGDLIVDHFKNGTHRNAVVETVSNQEA